MVIHADGDGVGGSRRQDIHESDLVISGDEDEKMILE
jgi:hypothetical protein